MIRLEYRPTGRDAAGRWIARPRDGGHQGDKGSATLRRLADRRSAATWILIHSGWAKPPPGWFEPEEEADTDTIPLEAAEAEDDCL
jgi:hypothetical protein